MEHAIQKNHLPNRFLRDLLTYCSTNNSIRKVVLYGSRARGDFSSKSDIDLALYTPDISHSEQNLIEDRILQIPTYLKVDIVFMNRLKNEQLIRNIEREGVVLYEQEETARKA